MLGLLIQLSFALNDLSLTLDQTATHIESAPLTKIVEAEELPILPEPPTVEEYVRASFIDAPIMIRIAQCESRLRQFNPDGSVLRGVVNPKDLGVFQINEYWNGDEAKRLGYNLHTLEGNVAMARVLYERNGTRDWNASKYCWERQ